MEQAQVQVGEYRIGFRRAGHGTPLLLLHGAVSDSRGVATLSDVPRGEWLLIGWREQVQASKPAKLRTRETTGFRDIPVSAGYALVTFWRMRLTVTANTVTSAELNDRNVWMTGVKEDLHFVDGAPARKTHSKKQSR